MKSRRPICDENVLAVPHTNNRRTKQYKRAHLSNCCKPQAQTEVENIFQRLEQISIQIQINFFSVLGSYYELLLFVAYPLTYATSAGTGLPAGFVQGRKAQPASLV